MNWTAILALLAVNGLLGYLAWVGLSKAAQARRGTREATYAAKDADANSLLFLERSRVAELEAQRLTVELEKSQTLHRNLLARQSRSASRKVQHQERGNAAD